MKKKAEVKRQKAKLLLVVFIGLVVCGSVRGQNTATVEGHLSEAGRPVSDRRVRLASSAKVFVSTTDANGDYRFENVPDGSYVLTSGSRQLNVFVNGGKPLITEITESVAISAGQQQPLEQVAKTVDVINQQELRDRADFTLIDSLRSIPGFRVQQLGGFGRVASVKTRGLPNQDTAVLIDGVRFRDPTAITGDTGAFLSDFTLTSIGKIEVLRGSGSSLYGTNAIGGVVDYQTPQATPGTSIRVGGAWGSYGLQRYRVNWSHGAKTGKFGITGAISRTEYTRGLDGDDNADNTGVQTRVDIAPSTRTTISGRVFFSDANVRLNANPDTKGISPATNATIVDAIPNVNFVPDANDPDSQQKTRFFSGQIVVNHVINSSLLLNGYYQGLPTRRRNANGPRGPGFQSASTTIFDGDIQTANAHLTWTPLSANTLTTGYEFESENFRNDGLTPSGTGNFSTRAGQRSNTFFVQDLASLHGGDLQIAGGLRAQKYNLNRPTFSLASGPYADGVSLSSPPTAVTLDGAASYFFRDSGTKVRAHVGNGYRVPSLYERFGTFFSSFGTPSFVALGDPFLKPEKSVAFDAGVEQNAVHDRVKLSATYFYTLLRDIIGFGNLVPSVGITTRPFGGYQNQKGGIARGGEFSLKAEPTNSTDVFLSYTYTNSDQRTPQVSGSRVNRTLGIPDHQFTVVATQRIQRFWINFDLIATSSYLAPIFSNSTFNTYVYRFRGNRRGDVTVGYTFRLKSDKGTLRAYGTVENIFKQEYYENGFRTPGVNGRIGLTFGF